MSLEQMLLCITYSLCLLLTKGISRISWSWLPLRLTALVWWNTLIGWITMMPQILQTLPLVMSYMKKPLLYSENLMLILQQFRWGVVPAWRYRMLVIERMGSVPLYWFFRSDCYLNHWDLRVQFPYDTKLQEEVGLCAKTSKTVKILTWLRLILVKVSLGGVGVCSVWFRVATLKTRMWKVQEKQMLLGIVFRPTLLTSVKQRRNRSNKSLILAPSTSLDRNGCSKSS